jgi:hypothetical protein
MRPASVRRMASSANGAGADQDPASRPISAMRMPTPYVRHAEPARLLPCHMPTLMPCSCISMRSPTIAPRAPTPFCFSTGPDGTQRPNSTYPKHHANLSALTCTRTQSRRKHLAVHSCQLDLQPRLRNLPRDHRGSMRRLAEAHCSTRDHYLYRNEAMGSYRSGPMTVGIISKFRNHVIVFRCACGIGSREGRAFSIVTRDNLW